LPAATPRPKLPPEDEAVLKVLYTSVDAADRGDLAAYLATLHPESPGYAASEVAARKLFESYDISFELRNEYVLSRDDQEARVSYSLIQRGTAGAWYRNNWAETVATFRKYHGHWRLYSQELRSVTYL